MSEVVKTVNSYVVGQKPVFKSMARQSAKKVAV